MPGRSQIEGSQIIDYQGNSNLALGGGAGLNVYGDTDASGISATARELALQAHGDNVMLWKQRIDDRDKVKKMIDDDEVSLDNILEQNRPYVEGKINDARDYFYGNAEKIMNDPAAYREYKSKLADAKNAAKQANTNYLLYSAEQKQLGATTNSEDANKRKQFLTTQLDKIKSDPNAFIDPYVPIANFDAAVVAAPPVYGAETQRQEGDYIIKESKVDAAKTLDAYRKKFFDPQYYDGFLQYVNKFKQNPDMINQVNAKLADVNKQLGLEGDAAIQPIDFTKDKTPDVAAKIALADNPPVNTKKEYAKEQIDDKLKKEQLGIEAQKAKDAAWKDRADIGLGYAKLDVDKQRANREDAEWKAKQGSSDSSVANNSITYANNLLSDVAGHGLAKFDVNISGVQQKATMLTPGRLNKISPEQKKYLGVVTNADGTISIQGIELGAGDGLVITDDRKVYKVPADKLKTQGTSYKFTGADLNLVTDVHQIADTRYTDEIQIGTGKEAQGFAVNDAQGQNGNTYGGTRTNTTTTSGKNAGSLKTSYKLPNGATYSLEKLRSLGYTDAQIQQAVQGGKLN